jgi:hypothetical protein
MFSFGHRRSICREFLILSSEKGKKVKLFLAAIFVTGIVLGAAYLGGVFSAKVDVTVNQKIKNDVAELTYDTIEKAQESTDRAFKALKDKLKENN